MSRASVRPKPEGPVDYKFKRGDDVTVDPIFSTGASSSNANSIFATIKMRAPADTLGGLKPQSGNRPRLHEETIDIGGGEKKKAKKQARKERDDEMTAAGKENANEHKYDDENDTAPTKAKKQKTGSSKATPPVASTSSFFSLAPTTAATSSLFGSKKQEVAAVGKKATAAAPAPAPIPTFNFFSTLTTSNTTTTTQQTKQTHKPTQKLTGVAAPEQQQPAKEKKEKKPKVKKVTEEMATQRQQQEEDVDMTDVLYDAEPEESKQPEVVKPQPTKKATKQQQHPPTVVDVAPVVAPIASTPIVVAPSAPIVAPITAPILPVAAAPTAPLSRRTPAKASAATLTTSTGSSSTTVESSTSTTPSFLRSSLSSLSPVPMSTRPVAPIGSHATSSAQALLTEYHSAIALQRLLRDKEAQFDTLREKFQSLKQARKAEATELVAQHQADGLENASRMVTHLKEEAQAREAELTRVRAELATFPPQVRALTQEKEREAEVKRAMEMQIQELMQKVTDSESLLAAQQSELAAAGVERARLEAKQASTDQVLRAYKLLSSTTITPKGGDDQGATTNTWVNCTMVNEAEERVLDFDLEVDAEEEIEYAPRRIDMNGVQYPAWMADSLSMQPEMAPRLLKIMLANVYKKEGDQ